ncbi:MAG TPA: hypothetical protein DD433_09160, partial [Ruminococcaceae bacterium]|nr:hypothetical protein [Oscillospiraceae bacterium]
MRREVILYYIMKRRMLQNAICSFSLFGAILYDASIKMWMDPRFYTCRRAALKNDKIVFLFSNRAWQIDSRSGKIVQIA